MANLKSPDLPAGNLYEKLQGMPEDSDAQIILQAAQAALYEFHVDTSAWNVVGNALIRFGCIVLVNGDFPVEDKDPNAVGLMQMGDEFLRRLGDKRLLSKLQKQP